MSKNSDFPKESYRERVPYRDNNNEKQRGHRSYSNSRRSSDSRNENFHHYSKNGDHEYNNERKHRSYNKNFHYDRDRRSRSRSKERDESYNNNRNYNYDSDNSRYNDRYEEKESYFKERKEIPNNTLIIRNLPYQVTEKDVNYEISKFGLFPKDVRLMRNKETGQSRGFAFIEFATVEQATQLKQLAQDVIKMGDDCECSIHYSFPKESLMADKMRKNDWSCFKCGINNFKRRDECFKCGARREDYEQYEDNDQSMYHHQQPMAPTNALLLRNLPQDATEETILFQIGRLTTLPIKSINMRVDGQKSNSCLVEMHSVYEATELFQILYSLPEGLMLNGHVVKISYGKKEQKSFFQPTNATQNAAMAALAAAQWKNLDDSSKSSTKSLGTVTLEGKEYKKYEPPNYSAFQYDASSGFYYDSSTGFYYDSNSQYFYNSQTQKYMYYDTTNQIYITVESDGKAAAATTATSANSLASATPNKAAETSKSNDVDKMDKAQMAKKIAKDMEKWAKALNNQKKETPKLQPTAIGFQPITTTTIPEVLTEAENLQSSTATFNVLEKQQTSSSNSTAATEETLKTETSKFNDPFEIIKNEEEKLIDHKRMACLLCKRQFNSLELLAKHQQLSELHKNNMSVLRRTHLNEEQLDHMEKVERELGYRDRAKERRNKYGIDDTPEYLKHKFEKNEKEHYPVDETSIPAPPISNDNIGNRMLKAMGWTEGTGLGKSNQGISGIIEVERRKSGLGLGNQNAKFTKESYKDAVRRTALQRFKEMNENK